jgi:hypothetical protein
MRHKHAKRAIDWRLWRLEVGVKFDKVDFAGVARALRIKDT